MDAVAALPPPAPSGAGGASPIGATDDAALFEKMVQGVLTAGLSLMNTAVGDTIDSLNEPFGDPDQ